MKNTTIARTSIQTFKRLIRSQFDRLDLESNYFSCIDEADTLIKTARDFGFNELAREMEIDMNSY